MHDYTKRYFKVAFKGLKNDLVYINPELFNFGIMKDAKIKKITIKHF